MKKTLFALIILALVIASLAGGAAFLMRQKHLDDMGRLAKQAEDKLNENSYDQAITMLRKVEAEGGTDRSAYLLGKAFSSQGKFEEANRYFEDLLKNYPKSPLVPEARLVMARYYYDNAKDPVAGQKQLLDILQFWPKSDSADFALVMLADASLDKGDEVQARKNLEIVMRKKDSPARDEAEFLIGDLNMKRLKSPEAAPGDEIYTIQPRDTVYVLSRKLKIPADLLVGINGLNPESLSIGQKIRVPRLQIALVVDKSKRTLTIRNNGDFLKKYRVGINRDDSKIPARDYKVTKKNDKGKEYTDPKTNKTFKPGVEGNPYGKRYIELGSTVAIHGTDDVEKIGKLVSEGMIEMSNQDIEEVYALVESKTNVTVKNSVNTQAN